jgi:hypothetical protein
MKNPNKEIMTCPYSLARLHARVFGYGLVPILDQKLKRNFPHLLL